MGLGCGCTSYLVILLQLPCLPPYKYVCAQKLAIDVPFYHILGYWFILRDRNIQCTMRQSQKRIHICQPIVSTANMKCQYLWLWRKSQDTIQCRFTYFQTGIKTSTTLHSCRWWLILLVLEMSTYMLWSTWNIIVFTPNLFSTAYFPQHNICIYCKFVSSRYFTLHLIIQMCSGNKFVGIVHT